MAHIPRERALMKTIKNEYPNWKNLKIHESSPVKRGHSQTLKKHATYYTTSQYYSNHPFGSIVNGFKNERFREANF